MEKLISNIEGGLGNQMFQYACARAISIKFSLPLLLLIDSYDHSSSHNGYELSRVFNLNVPLASRSELIDLLGKWRSNFLVRKILSKNLFPWVAGKNFIAEPHFRYWHGLIDKAANGGYLHGYWQSEKYFLCIKDQIKSDFLFRHDLSAINLQLMDAISKSCSVSLHIRRGDYVQNSKISNFHGTCDINYYLRAMNIIVDKFPQARFFAFSDDPDWVRQEILSRYPSVTVVEHNKGAESFNDMRLMSACRHQIIANSSFSWWAAWLNNNPEKMVIATKKWFASGENCGDLVPADWVRI